MTPIFAGQVIPSGADRVIRVEGQGVRRSEGEREVDDPFLDFEGEDR